MAISANDDEATRQILAVLGRRGEKTVCPSEIARLLAGKDGDWRSRMDEVHGAVDEMLGAGRIGLSWKGKPMAARAGPYRIAAPG